MSVEDRSPQKVRKGAFYVLVLVFAAMHIFLTPLPFAFLGWFLEEEVVSHRVHETIFGFVFVLSFVALLLHLRRPETKVAQMYQVVLPPVLIAVAFLIVDRALDPIAMLFITLPVILLLLHPNRPAILRPAISPSVALGIAALIAAVPAVAFAAVEFRTGLEASRTAPAVLDGLPEDATEGEYNAALRAATDGPEEFEAAQHYGHWSAVGGYMLTIVSLAAIGALRMPGWRLSTWSAALAAIVFGLVSLLNPDDASAASGVWAVLALLWGGAFVFLAEREHRSESRGSGTRSGTLTPIEEG